MIIMSLNITENVKYLYTEFRNKKPNIFPMSSLTVHQS